MIQFYFKFKINFINIFNFKMFLFLVHIFITGPIFEWGTHLILHKTNNKIHKSHHIEFHNKNISIEYWPIPLIVIFIYFKLYMCLIPCLRYYIVHTLIHKKPKWVKKYARHHEIHHIHTNCNYGVSTIWPDILFGTKFKSNDNKY